MSTRMAELLVAFGLLLFSLGMMWNIWTGNLVIGWIPERGPGGGMWPFWLSFGMALASAWTLWRWYRGTTPESRDETPYIDPDHMGLVAISFISLTVMVILVDIVGTFIAVAVFMGFYMRVIGKHGWGITIAFILGTPIFIYVLFEWQLTANVPKGWPMFEDGFYWLDDYRWQFVSWWNGRG